MANRWERIIDEAVQGPSVLFNPNGCNSFQAALAAIIETPIPPQNPSRHLANSLETAVQLVTIVTQSLPLLEVFLG